jgi:5-methylcytosine-specific restriction endonuclease McrA
MPHQWTNAVNWRFANLCKARRLLMLRAWGGSCVYCGLPLGVGWRSVLPDPAAQFTIDHIVPVCLGGSREITNLAPACGHCNSNRGHARITPENERLLLERAEAIGAKLMSGGPVIQGSPPRLQRPIFQKTEPT